MIPIDMASRRIETSILKKLLRVVKGAEPPDAVVRGGRIFNVFTNTIDEGLSVLIKDGWIASVEKDRGEASYPEARMIDAGGLTLVPGFIDAHTHLDTVLPFEEFAPYAIRGGTTTVVTETSAVACACGLNGVLAFIDSCRDFPVRSFFLAPPLTPPFPLMESSSGLTLKEFTDLVKRDDFVGIGEAYWTRIVDGDERVLKQARAAMALGKALDGHAAGARGSRLVEYVLTGITSCHESTTVEEVLEKLRLGLTVMIREGWVRRELDELYRIKDLNIDYRRILLVSDVFDPVMLFNEGYLDSIVRKAIGLGIPAGEAIKMATINPADYYGLRHLGAIAPLRHADILFLDDIDTVAVRHVMANGETVLFDGHFLPDVRHHPFPPAMTDTITAGPWVEGDFVIPAEGELVKARVIDIVSQTITREQGHTLTVKNGGLEPDRSRDIAAISVTYRLDKGRQGKGFIRGTGIRDGALATTLIWDTGNILSIGSSYADMTVASNRLLELKGGTVIVKNGVVIYEFPMPVFGVMAALPFNEIRRKIESLDGAMKEIGTALERPFLTIQTIPFTGLPFLRITDKGLVNIKTRSLVPLTYDR